MNKLRLNKTKFNQTKLSKTKLSKTKFSKTNLSKTWPVTARLCANSSLYVNSQEMSATPNHKSGPRWTYSNQTGPTYWVSMANEFTLSGSGKRQSPLNLNHHIGNNINPLVAQHSALYSLQFNYHRSSEYERDDNQTAMEVHLVHKNASGNFAIVEVMLTQGNQNNTLQKIINKASNDINLVNTVKNVSINTRDLQPQQQNIAHYSDLLTTPSSSENINWYVMEHPIQVLRQQINSFNQYVGENARPVQQINWRSLLLSQNKIDRGVTQ